MPPKEGTKKKRKPRIEASREDPEEPSKVLKPKKEEPVAVPASLGGSTPAQSAAVLNAINGFTEVTRSLGIEGLRDQYLGLKSYESPNFASTAFAANAGKNRYPDVHCLDETRVKLTPELPGEGDYIHANWCKLEGHDKTYIATQGPTDVTLVDFWRMCWEHDVVTVVQLCRIIEDGKQKFCQYWPEKQGDFKYFGKFFVNNRRVDVEEKFTTVTIELLPNGCSDSRIIKLIQFGQWPDKGVPLKGVTVLRFLRLIASGDKLIPGNIAIHCSAGIGRTGTVILIDWVLQRLFKGLQADVVSLFRTLRNQRAHAIQTELQYIFVSTTVIDYVSTKYPEKFKAIAQKLHDEHKALALRTGKEGAEKQ